MRLLSAFLLFTAASASAQTGTDKFEAASLKRSPERSGEARFVRMSDGRGRIAYENINLTLLVSRAFGVDSNNIQSRDGRTESAVYDLAATFPADATRAQIQAMLRALLAERMGLVVHTATKEVDGLELYPDPKGVKLTPSTAETANTPSMLAGRIYGSHISMDHLAGMLGIRIGRPVVDKTGQTGMFEIDLHWTPDAVNGTSPNEDSGGSIYTAVREQLGLRLRPTKTTVQTLVIDKANREPSEP